MRADGNRILLVLSRVHHGTWASLMAQSKVNTGLSILLAALVAAFLGVIGWSIHDQTVQEGDTAPEFSVRTDQGQQITPASFGGKVLVLNFWATWCPPCVQEIPSLSQFQQRFQDSGVVVVAVSVDKNEKKYKNFINRFRVAFQTTRDPAADISAKYGTFQYPETYIIKDGRVVKKIISNRNWTDEETTQMIQGLL